MMSGKKDPLNGHGLMRVERGIPLPGVKTAPKYPWDTMAVGDSFLSPGVNLESMRAQVAHAGNRRGYRFIARSEGDGVRVWRVA